MKTKTMDMICKIAVAIFAITFTALSIWDIFSKESPKEMTAEDKLQGTVIEIVESPAGFDVYVRDSLVYEFTQQNCDSNSLETLEMLFNAEKELRSQNK